MNANVIGDGARYLSLSLANTKLKNELNRLSAQLSDGEISDKAKALKGDTSRFSAIDHSLKTLDASIVRNNETSLMLGVMQRSLDGVNEQRGELAETLTKITRDSSSVQVDESARNAVERFATMVSMLNTDLAGKRLFSGTAVDKTALASANDMLADILAALGGATDFAKIEATVNAWFDDPGGGFETVGYLGEDGAFLARRLDENRIASIPARADTPEIRATLKGAALAALADQIPGLAQATRTDLLFQGGLQLHSAASSIVDVQARIGFLEGEVERVITAQTAEVSALSQARNDLVNDDPFETASALQALQVQLETHYQMTARLSRLSLAEYI
ncbi:MAG: flagellin [Pseudomonadota bacterium]